MHVPPPLLQHGTKKHILCASGAAHGYEIGGGGREAPALATVTAEAAAAAEVALGAKVREKR